MEDVLGELTLQGSPVLVEFVCNLFDVGHYSIPGPDRPWVRAASNPVVMAVLTTTYNTSGEESSIFMCLGEELPIPAVDSFVEVDTSE